MTTPSRRLLVACLALLLAASAACGRKTLPQVPDSPRPEAVTGIKAVTRDTVAFLSWPLPTRNIEGRSMNPEDIRRFRIYRAEFGLDRKKARYKPYVELDMETASPASAGSGMVAWRDEGLRYGQTYGYVIRAVSARGGISRPSEEARVTPLMSLAVPRGLAVRGGDGNNRLTWEPVTTRMDGGRYDGFVGYNVYRGTEKGAYDKAPLNREPLKTTSYKDTSVANNSTYYYMIRSVDGPALPWTESPDSDDAFAVPRDMTPPGRPAGLTVVAGVGRAFLTWNENKERDLAGYYVYRATGDRRFVRITDTVLTRTTFFDDTVKSGATYSYCVTAVDTAGNESARSEKKQATLEKLR